MTGHIEESVKILMLGIFATGALVGAAIGVFIGAVLL